MKRQHWLLCVLAGAVGVGGCHPPKADRQDRAARDLETQVPSEARGSTLHPRVSIETSLGDIVVELYGEEAPAAALSFVGYVQDRFYDGTVFHRVLKDSMIQGGAYTPDMEEKTAIPRSFVPVAWGNELSNQRGTVAMIRGQGKAGMGTAQFFINVVGNPELESARSRGLYAIFGKVVEGMETVDKIRDTPVGTDPKYAAGRAAVVPLEPVVIKSVRLLDPFDTARAKVAAAAVRSAGENRLNARIKEIEEKAGAKVVTTESGLRYVDFFIGKGPSPLLSDTIEFHYRGVLADGTEFETTYLTEPAVRQLAKLIAGLREGLMAMNEGGQRTLIIPPELAFGEGGVPGRVPPDSTLIFEIELLAVK